MGPLIKGACLYPSMKKRQYYKLLVGQQQQQPQQIPPATAAAGIFFTLLGIGIRIKLVLHIAYRIFAFKEQEK
jgi:hypothetical protein